MLNFRRFRRARDMAMISQSQIDFYNEMVRQFQRAFINLENLTANNLMIINYLNQEYIFKQTDESSSSSDSMTDNSLATIPEQEDFL